VSRLCNVKDELGPYDITVAALGHHVRLGAFDLTSLRSLRIELAPPKASLLRTPASWFWTYVTVFLQRLNTPALEHLRFWFRVDEESLELPPDKWSSITAALARPCFSSLKTLLFEVEGGLDNTERAIERIRLHLSAYEESGILKFAEFRW
jgi:hypothetical protein